MPGDNTTKIIRAGLAGLGVLAAGIVWTAVHFKNADGTAFNPLRNFVSELGSEKASHMAAVFNLCLVVSSLLLFPLVYTLASRLDGRVRRLALVAGICSLIGSVSLGFVSMDHLKLHLAGAMLFFWGWLATTLVFTVGLWRKYSFRQTPGLLLSGIVSALMAALFLTVLITALVEFLNGAFKAPKDFQRPAVWDIAVLEWCVVASFCVWILMALVHLRRPRPKSS